jgi:hypothetical protein
MFFAARSRPVAEAFRTVSGSVPARPEGLVDPYVTSLQWSRRFIGHKRSALPSRLPDPMMPLGRSAFNAAPRGG